MRRPRLSGLCVLLLLFLLLVLLYPWPQQPVQHLPEVAVILPVFNAAEFLEQALSSLDRQTFRSIELVIVDDGSTDRSPVIISSWASARPWVTVLTHKHNLGLPAALNAGLRAARASLLTWVSADNVPERTFAERLRNVLSVCGDCDLAFADHDNIDVDGRSVSHHVLRRPPRWATIVRGNPGLAAFMFRRGCFDSAGPYRDDLQGVEDWEMWGRMLSACAGKAAYVASNLMGYRVHGDRLTHHLGPMRAELEDKAREAIWDGAGGAARLTENAIEIAMLWHQDPAGVQQELLVEAAQGFADRHGARPAASLLRVLRDTLSACVKARPVSLQGVLCAANSIVIAADDAALGGQEFEDLRKYALFLYDQLGGGGGGGGMSGAQAARIKALLAPQQPGSGVGFAESWIPMTTSRQLRRIRKLLDSAYTIHDATSTMRPVLVIGSARPSLGGIVQVWTIGLGGENGRQPSVDVKTERLGEYIGAVDPTVIHAKGAGAIRTVCGLSLPKYIGFIVEGMASECGRAALHVVSDLEAAHALASAKIDPEHILIRSDLITDSVLYRIAAAVGLAEAQSGV